MTKARLVSYMVIAGSVAILVATPFLKSAIEARLVGFLEQRGSELSSTSVSIEKLRLTLIPSGARADGIRLEGVDPAAAPLSGSIEQLELRGGLLELLGLRSGLIDIDVVRPRFSARVIPRDDEVSSGSDPAWGRLTAALSAIPFAWKVALSDGEFDLAASERLAVDLRGIEIDLQSRRGFAMAGGRVAFARGEIRGMPGRWEGLNGEAGLELTRKALLINSFVLRGPGLTMTGAGSLAEGAPLSAKAEMQVEMQHDFLVPLLPPTAAPRGILNAELKGAWEEGTASLSGTLDLEGLQFWEVEVDNLHTALRLDETLQLDGIRMEILGGQGQGTMEVGFDVPGTPMVTARVRFDSIDVGKLAALAGWHGPELTGTLSYDGEHALAGLDPAGLSGSGKVQLDGRYRSPRGGDLPLSASVVVGIAGTALRLSDGTLRAGSARSGFSGTFTPEGGFNLRLNGATGDLSELLLFLPQPHGTAPAGPARGGSGRGQAGPAAQRSVGGHPTSSAAMVGAVWRGGRRGQAVRAAERSRQPAPQASMRQLEDLLGSLGGRWEYDGEIGYAAGAIRFEGELRGRDLQILGESLGTLIASVTYEGGVLRIDSATLQRPAGGSLLLSGRVGIGEAGGIELSGEVAGFPADVISRLAGLDLPIEGIVGAAFEVDGTREQPEVRMKLETGMLLIAGVQMQSVHGDLIVTPYRIAGESLRLVINGSSIELDGGLRLRGDGDPRHTTGDEEMERLELVARDIDLSSLAPLLGEVPLAGRADIRGSIGGSLDAPLGHLAIEVAGLRVWDVDVGPGSIDAQINPQRLSFKGEIPGRQLSLQGKIELDEIGRFELNGQLAEVTIRGEDLLKDPPEGSRLTATGELSIIGELRRPADLSAGMELSLLRLILPGLEVENSAPVIARLQDREIRLDPVELTGVGTRIDLRGTLELGEEGAVDASATGHFDLALLRTVVQQLHATGRGEIGVTMRGAYDSPDLRGDLKLDAERVRYTGVGIPIDKLKAHLIFEGEEMRVEELRFLVGGGPTMGSGTLVLGNSDREGGFGAIRSGTVRLQGDDVKASVPEGFHSVSDLDLRLTIGSDGARLHGRVDLIRGIYTKDFRVESSLMSDNQPAVPELPPLAGVLEEVKLDCTLSATGEVGLRNDLGRIDGEGVLKVGGTVARPELTGRLTALEGGRVTLRNVRYRVTQGTLDFDDPLSIDPTVEIRAETAVDEYQISLSIRGKVDNFDYELTSTPPLPEADIVALLVTGRTLGEIGTQGGGFAEGIASSYLAGQVTQELTDQIALLSALDVLAIDPLYVNGQGDPTTRITVGKKITPDLFVTYSDVFGSDQGSIYQLDYSISRDFRFSSVRDSDSSIGGDFNYSLRSLPPWLPGLESGRPGEVRREIAGIRIEGDPRFKESRVLRRAKLKPGRRRSRAELFDAVDRLLNFYRGRGYLMTDIRMEDSLTTEGKFNLVIDISTGPKIDMKFTGIHGREGLRQKAEPFWEEGLFMEEIMETVRVRLEEYIRERGYLTAKVEAEIQNNDADAFQVLFRVSRGPRAQARSIELEGVNRLPRDEVMGEIRSSTDTWKSRGIVRGNRLDKDRASIRKLYLDEGFARVEVPSPQIELDEAGEWAEITFHVKEGPRAILHGVRFEGADSLGEEQLRLATGLRAGDPYRADRVEAAIVELRRTYDTAGFPDARVTVAKEILTRHGGYELIDVTFWVIEGLPQRVDEINVKNNLITKEETIRRSLMMTPGDPLSREVIQEGRSRLYRTGSFRGVQIETLPPETAEVDDGVEELIGPRQQDDGMNGTPDPGVEQYRPVRVTVQEAGRFRQLYGIGYDSQEKLRGQYEIANRNLFGTGRYLGLQARASEIKKRASVAFRESGLFGGRFDALVSAYWQDEELVAYDAQRVGGAIQLSRRVSRATELRYRYSIEDVDVFDPNNVFDGSTLRLSSLDFSASHDTRDNLFNPLRGHYLLGDFQVSGRFLGSEADFTRFYAQIYTFREVFPSTVWAQAVRVGIGVPYGRSKRDPASTGDPQSGMPPTRRFFAGGDTTIRGFELNRVGPLDSAGDPIGGEGLFILNEELRYPIFSRLQGVVFYDAGNVFHTLREYSLRDIRHVLGAGLRFATPIGPFRLEYGRILDPKPTDTSRGEFFISIGQAF